MGQMGRPVTTTDKLWKQSLNSDGEQSPPPKNGYMGRDNKNKVFCSDYNAATLFQNKQQVFCVHGVTLSKHVTLSTVCLPIYLDNNPLPPPPQLSWSPASNLICT